MKYFVIADVHGFYDAMIKALNDAGFDETNPNHMLISLGDVLDRGDQPVQILEYLNRLYKMGKAILVRGNHEDLMVDMLATEPHMHDEWNGTVDTAKILGAKAMNVQFVSGKWLRSGWRELANAIQEYPEWKFYNEHTINFFETEHYVFVHGWVPLYNVDHDDGRFITFTEEIYPDWRNDNAGMWREARWTNGYDMTKEELFLDKTIVCGHIHTSYWHYGCEGADKEIFTPYISDKVIACDACTAYSGFVNCVVLED